MASGTTHSSGIAEMFWQMWFDTASNRNEPIAASVAQSNWRPCVGGPLSGVSVAESSAPVPLCAPALCRLYQPHAAHRIAYSTYAPDQPHDCRRVVTHGSSAKGYPSSASIDARFDR